MLGSGLGTWFQNEVQEGYGGASGMSFLRAHNDLLELATELGLIGVGLIIWGAVAISVAVLSMLRKTILSNDQESVHPYQEHAYMGWFCLLIWTALFGSFVQMQFTFPYQEAGPIFIFGLLLGLVTRYSETFLPAIKTIHINVSKVWHWFYRAVRVVGIIAMVLVVSIYVDWIKHYMAMQAMVEKQKIGQIQLPKPSLYSSQYPKLLDFLSTSYKDNPQIVQFLEQHALQYWPNNLRAMTNMLHTSLQLQNYQVAWAMIERIRTFTYPDYLIDDFAELIIYRDSGEQDKFDALFTTIVHADEALLAQQSVTYRNLLMFSLQTSELMQFSEAIYQKSLHYHGYHCLVENYIAEYYWRIGAYAKAFEHVNIIKSNKDEDCLDPSWDKLMDQYQLTIIIDQAKNK